MYVSPYKLVTEARAAGLTLLLDGDKLNIRGPRSAEPLIKRLGRHKPEVVEYLRRETRGAEYVRSIRLVYKRDRGVCCMCGFDAGKLARILAFATTMIDEEGSMANNTELKREVCEILGIPHGRQRFWEADHIVPESENGTFGVNGNPIGNLRTLCIDCHRSRTNYWLRTRTRKPC